MGWNEHLGFSIFIVPLWPIMDLLWLIMGASWGHSGRSWVHYDRSRWHLGAIMTDHGSIMTDLGRIWRLSWTARRPIRPVIRGTKRTFNLFNLYRLKIPLKWFLWSNIAPKSASKMVRVGVRDWSWDYFDRSWGHYGRSWGHLVAIMTDHGSIMTVLFRS